MKEQRKSKRERTRLAVANLKTPCRNSEAPRQGYERYLKDQESMAPAFERSARAVQ